MSRKNYKIDEVIKSLSRKQDCKIMPQTEEILILANESRFPKANDLGNGSFGKIDFLVNHCGWKKYFVWEF